MLGEQRVKLLVRVLEHSGTQIAAPPKGFYPGAVVENEGRDSGVPTAAQRRISVHATEEVPDLKGWFIFCKRPHGAQECGNIPATVKTV